MRAEVWDQIAIAATRGQRLGMRASWFARPLPDAIILGAMKSGSTSLYEWLGTHPQVRGAVRKEVHFLDMHFERGTRWYRAQFPLAPPSRRWVAMEATPMYLSFPPAPARLHDVGIQPRFVVLLRDPVARAVSQWKQRTREGRENRSLEQVVADERDLSADDLTHIARQGIVPYQQLILAHGLYAAQIRRWYSYFDRECFLIVEAQQFFDGPQGVMDDVCRFVGIEPAPLADAQPRNMGDARLPDEASTRALADFYRRPNEDLYELLGTRYPWRS